MAKTVNSILKLKELSQAEMVYRQLNGLICIYKPPDMNMISVYQKLKHALVNGLNELPCRPVENRLKIDEEKNIAYVDKDLADTVEALGARYARADFRINFMHPLDEYDSGVQIACVNEGEKMLWKLDSMRLMRAYELKGRFGLCTSDFTPRGNLVNRCTYSHVNRSKMDRVAASIQGTYQREMYKHFGVDVQSQEAFELASKGLLRPKSTRTPPQIYSLRCVEYDRPFFKLEVYCINESTRFLRNLIHDYAIRLRTYAICEQIRRIKDGFVDLSLNSDAKLSSNDCLVYNDWNLENIRDNLTKVTEITGEYIKKYDKTIVVSQTNDRNPKGEPN